MLTAILSLCDPHVGSKVNYGRNRVVHVNTVKMAALPRSSSSKTPKYRSLDLSNNKLQLLVRP